MNHASHQPANADEKEIWDYLQEHPRVTIDDIARNCAATEWRRSNYLRSLRRKGILKPCGATPGDRRQVLTIFDTADAIAFAATRSTSVEAAIWQSMRILGTFTVHDLIAALSSVEGIRIADITRYCALLQRIKYLAVIGPGKAGQTRRWKLTKNTGPLPPEQKRMTVVIDRNEDRIVFAGGERL